MNLEIHQMLKDGVIHAKWGNTWPNHTKGQFGHVVNKIQPYELQAQAAFWSSNTLKYEDLTPSYIAL